MYSTAGYAFHDFSAAALESRRTVDLHPNDHSDRSVRLQMEHMELSSGDVEEQPETDQPRPDASSTRRDNRAPADEPMDQCTYCTVYSNSQRTVSK